MIQVKKFQSVGCKYKYAVYNKDRKVFYFKNILEAYVVGMIKATIARIKGGN
jgi:hypothetical protein